jgi:hypothetical protein
MHNNSPEALTAPQQLARTALLEITPENTIGVPAGEIDEGNGVVSYLFENEMSGYPGWKWTVTVATVEGAEPTVLETELTPAEGALLAPAWVPWEDRMDEQRAAQDALADDDEDADDEDEESDEDDSDDAEDEDDDSDDDDDDSDDDESDDDDDDDDVRPVLHAGDLDGVDIDELDETNDDAGDASSTPSEPEPEPELAETEVVIIEDATAEVVEVVEVPVGDVDTAAAEVAVVASVEVPDAEVAEVAQVVAPAAEVDDPRYAEPVADVVRAPRRSRRASSASIAPKAE